MNLPEENTMNGFSERPSFRSSNTLTQLETTTRESSFKDFGSTMNAISLGFVATAILISMFLIMAILEHILRSRGSISSSQNNAQGSLAMGGSHGQIHSLGKLRNSHPVEAPQPPDFSVLMPGQLYPTYLAQPAPHPCQREGICWASHDHYTLASP